MSHRGRIIGVVDDPDVELIALAESQHGLVSTAQALAVGLSKSAWSRRRSSTDWERIAPRVARRRGAPSTDRQRVLLAVFDAGPFAVLTGTSAAALWGIGGFSLLPASLCRPWGGSRRVGPGVHLLRAIPPDLVTVLDGIPVARPELVAYHLCASVHPRRAERGLDALWSLAVLSGDSTRAVLDRLAARGRDGTTLLRRLLDDRGPGYVPPASGIEARFQYLARDVGVHQLRRQVACGGDRWIGRVDFRHEQLPLVIEVQSELHHAALSDQRADAERRSALVAAGFEVLEVWDTEVWHHGPEVQRRLRAAVSRLSSRSGVRTSRQGATF